MERHNTNLEEHNTADVYTKMFGGIQNAVARQDNVDLESWMVRKVTTESL